MCSWFSSYPSCGREPACRSAAAPAKGPDRILTGHAAKPTIMGYRLEAFDRRGFVHVAPSRDRRFLRNPSQPRSGRRIGQFSPAGGTEPGPANVRAGDRALRMSRAGVGVHERRRDEPDGGGTTRPGHPSAANTAMPSTWQVRRRTGPSDTTFLRPPNTSARPNTTRRAKPTSLGASFSAAIARAASPVPP